MGLSDGERFAQIAHIVNHLYKLPRFELYGRERINKILDGLWFDFLGRQSNSIHWILGSDSSAHHLSECSLMAVEFAASTYQERREPKEHTPFEWVCDYRPDAERLLDGENGQLWKLVQLTEAYFYAANRYQDKFSDGLEKLTRSICELRGICFNIMQSNWRFAAAWMMQAIIEKYFPYSDDDIMTVCGNHFSWHHVLRVDGQDVVDIKKTFKRYQFADMTTHERMITILRWMGRQFHYEHEHKDLLARIQEWNANTQLMIDLREQELTEDEINQEIAANPEAFKALDWINEKEVIEICAKAKSAHEEHEKDSRDSYDPYCSFTRQSKSYPSRENE